MKALLLAAGLGTRLRPITDTIPKCLVPVKGKPLIGYWFELLFGKSEVDRILVNTHYFPDVVRAYISQSRWRDRIDMVHEENLLGTGGTVRANRSWFGEAPFLVAHADNLTIFSPSDFFARHASRPAGCAITMMTFDTDTPESCGIVEEKGGVVVEFHEKVTNPPGRRANAAVYIFEPEVLDFLALFNRPEIDISLEVLPHYLGRICSFHNTAYHRDIGTPLSLEAANRDFPG